MANQRLAYLFHQVTTSSATAEEKAEWLSLVDQPDHETDIRKLIDEYLLEEKSELQVPDETTAAILKNIIPPRIGQEQHWQKWVVAAALLSVVVGIFLLARQHPNQQTPATAKTKISPVDAGPGTDKAVLTLADGTVIKLDSTGHQTIRQADVVVTQQNGKLQYSGRPTAETLYNTLTTPRGSQFRVVLPDNTQVWLNAASILRYPVAFTGPDRTVELTGEGYFEVARDKSHPFYVKSGNTTVQVLGTHFNIMAYPDEKTIRTTLLEGAVKVISDKDALEHSPAANQRSPDALEHSSAASQLSPGMQADVDRISGNLTTGPGNIEEAVAWKEGYFLFDGADLPVLLRRFGRWYNIDVIYQGQDKAYEFVGKIPRTAHLSAILKVFQANNINYTFEKGRLTIKP